jgi:hypothetical protein
MHFANTIIPSPYALATIESWVDNETFLTSQLNNARNSNNWNPTWEDDEVEEVPQENPRDALEELQGAGFEYIDDPLGLKTGAQTEEKKACFERYKNLLDSVFRNDENLCNTGDLFDGRNQEICQFYLLLNEMRLAP